VEGALVMELSMSRDAFGRIACRIRDAGNEATVTAGDAVNASLELLAAIQDAEESGYGDCLWQEATGEYKWMLRRDDAAITVAIMWSSGTLTGWRHVLRGDTDFNAFAEQVRTELAQLGDTARSE
jgi:hypothetical protein